MIRRPPRSTRTDTLFPYTTLFRSVPIAQAYQKPELLYLLPATAPIFILTGLTRSEEHTSELQSLMRISYAVFCLKKKRDAVVKYGLKYATCSMIHRTIDLVYISTYYDAHTQYNH